MAGQNKPSFYTHRDVFVDGVAIAANFSSAPQDLRKFARGVVKLEWSGYDADDGTVNLQITDEETTDDSKYGDWGGADGKRVLDAASGTQVWELDEVGPVFMRFNLLIGSGTTTTITVSITLGH